MFVIAGFGVFIIAVSLVMIVRPDVWVDKATRYCRQAYMHPVEILLCLSVGIGFIVWGDTSRFPTVLTGFGYMMTAIGVGLALVPRSLHQRYGVWSVHKTARYLRPAGVASLILGGLLVYAAF